MAFIKDAARGGLFGLAGSLIAGKEKKDRPKPSLTSGDWNSSDNRSSSLLNQKHIY